MLAKFLTTDKSRIRLLSVELIQGVNKMNKSAYYDERILEEKKENHKLYKKKLNYLVELHEGEPQFLERTKSFLTSDNLSTLINSSLALTVQTKQSFFDNNWLTIYKKLACHTYNYNTFSYRNESIQFDSLLCKFVSIALEYLENKDQPFNDIVRNTSINYLKKILLEVAYQTLVLELNVSKEQGQLIGNTSEERYTYYNNELLTSPLYLEQLFDEYPVLLRMLCQRTIDWINSVTLFNTRLKKDQNIYSNDYDQIQEINIGLGDPHNNGNFNASVTFKDGNKIMYKPRSHSIDEKYQNLIEWINASCPSLSLRTQKIMNMKSYGWSEYIEYLSCSDSEDVNNYYYNLGGVLCLLYSLGAVDFHSENIIAHGIYPMLVDLETLMHNKNLPVEENKTAHSKAMYFISRSVQSTGLLPFDIYFGNDKQEVMDLSGMRGENSNAKVNVRVLKNPLRDDTLVKKELMDLPKDNNAPNLNEFETTQLDYLDTILQGFNKTYKTIQQNKNSFINLLNEFKHVETRSILKPTTYYASALHKSFHPDFLRDSVDRELLLTRLISSNATNLNKEVITSEIKQLINTDIPYFFSVPALKDLKSSQGLYIKNYYNESAYERAIKTLNLFSDEDLKQQNNIIRMSLLASHNAEHHKEERLISEINIDNIYRKTPNPLALAKKAGEHLYDKRIKGDENDVTWISTLIQGTNQVSWSVSPVNLDFYNGLSGIGIFTSYLDKYDNRDIFSKVTLEIVNTIKKSISHMEKIKLTTGFECGAFTGLSGYMYFLQHAAKNQNKKEWINEIYRMLPLLRSGRKNIKSVDILDGHAGIAMVLLSLYEDLKDDLFLKEAEVSIQFMMDSKIPLKNGIGWKDSQTNRFYTGFAHGSSGVATALAKYNYYINNTSIENTIYKILEFEDSLYESTSKNWFASFEKDNIPFNWCHGAPGIIMARNRLRQYGIDNEHITNSIKFGIESTLENGFGHTRCQCHGDAGNINILQTFKEKNVQDFLEEQLKVQEAYFHQNPFERGVSRGVEAVGFMIGIAGIGYSMLKQHDNRLPNILELEPPQ